MRHVFTFVGLILLAGTLAFSQATPAPVPHETVQPKSDTAGTIKMRLKAYEAEQKQALRLAKLQTKQTLEQLKLVQIEQKYTKKVAIEVAKGQ